MRLQIATPGGQREMTAEEEDKFIASRPQSSQVRQSPEKTEVQILREALIKKGILTEAEASLEVTK